VGRAGLLKDSVDQPLVRQGWSKILGVCEFLIQQFQRKIPGPRWSPWLVDDYRPPFFIWSHVDFLRTGEVRGPPKNLKRLSKSEVGKLGGKKITAVERVHHEWLLHPLHELRPAVFSTVFWQACNS